MPEQSFETVADETQPSIGLSSPISSTDRATLRADYT